MNPYTGIDRYQAWLWDLNNNNNMTTIQLGDYQLELTIRAIEMAHAWASQQGYKSHTFHLKALLKHYQKTKNDNTISTNLSEQNGNGN